MLCWKLGPIAIFFLHSNSQLIPGLQKSGSQYHRRNTERHPELESGHGCHKASPDKSRWYQKPKQSSQITKVIIIEYRLLDCKSERKRVGSCLYKIVIRAPNSTQLSRLQRVRFGTLSAWQTMMLIDITCLSTSDANNKQWPSDTSWRLNCALYAFAFICSTEAERIYLRSPNRNALDWIVCF